MLKDPNNTDVTPYEFLALSLDAPSADVQKALPRFIKRDPKNRAHIGRAQEAVRKLQNPKSRAAIDIWFYNVEVGEVDDASDGLPAVNLDEFRSVPAIPPQGLYSDLEGAPIESDFRQLSVAQVKFSDVKIFDGIEDIKVRPQFDV